MVDLDKLNYGGLYSLHPDYIRHESEPIPSHEEESVNSNFIENIVAKTPSAVMIAILTLMLSAVIAAAEFIATAPI